jgi:hypothetical protein
MVQARLPGDDVSNGIACQGLEIRETCGMPFWVIEPAPESQQQGALRTIMG